MKIIWSPHALKRAKQRGGTWERFRNHVEGKIESREWDEFYEYDPREGRGVCRNLLVRVCFVSALVRVGSDDVYIVVSILTRAQREFNETTMWSKDARQARLRYETSPRATAELGVRPRGLTHSPFSNLKGRS